MSQKFGKHPKLWFLGVSSDPRSHRSTCQPLFCWTWAGPISCMMLVEDHNQSSDPTWSVHGTWCRSAIFSFFLSHTGITTHTGRVVHENFLCQHKHSTWSLDIVTIRFEIWNLLYCTIRIGPQQFWIYLVTGLHFNYCMKLLQMFPESSCWIAKFCKTFDAFCLCLFHCALFWTDCRCSCVCVVTSWAWPWDNMKVTWTSRQHSSVLPEHSTLSHRPAVVPQSSAIPENKSQLVVQPKANRSWLFLAAQLLFIGHLHAKVPASKVWALKKLGQGQKLHRATTTLGVEARQARIDATNCVSELTSN